VTYACSATPNRSFQRTPEELRFCSAAEYIGCAAGRNFINDGTKEAT
jgi:hypothetical protein